MKQITFTLVTALLLGLSSHQALSQIPPTPPPPPRSPMDLALQNYRLDGISQQQCGTSIVNISFDIRNKLSSFAKCRIIYRVNGNEVFFSTTCRPTMTSCFELAANQTRRISANVEVQNSWVAIVPSLLLIEAKPANDLFHENTLWDNKIETEINFSNASTPENSFCACSMPGNSIIDTSALYVIHGYVKKQVGSLAISSAMLAIAFNLKPSLTQNDAARFKFRCVGHFNEDQTLPIYTIEFSGTGSIMTRDNNLLTFRDPDGSNAQKWILKKNSLGGYNIFSIKETGKPCMAWGPNDSQPLVDSPLLLSAVYKITNIFQNFNIIKLQ
jgi:hypothetical protein